MDNDIQKIEEALFRGINDSLRDIEGCLDPKVVSQVVDLVNYIDMCRDAKLWIEHGYTLDQWIDKKLDDISTSSNLCNESKAGVRKQLDMFTNYMSHLLS